MFAEKVLLQKSQKIHDHRQKGIPFLPRTSEGVAGTTERGMENAYNALRRRKWHYTHGTYFKMMREGIFR
jgi:hypothetical protein